METEEKLKELHETVESQFKCFSILRQKRQADINVYTVFVQEHLNGTHHNVSAEINSATQQVLESLQTCIGAEQEKIKQEADDMDELSSFISDLEYSSQESLDIYKQILDNLKNLMFLDKKLFEFENSVNASNTCDEDMVVCDVKALLQRLSNVYKSHKV